MIRPFHLVLCTHSPASLDCSRCCFIGMSAHLYPELLQTDYFLSQQAVRVVAVASGHTSCFDLGANDVHSWVVRCLVGLCVPPSLFSPHRRALFSARWENSSCWLLCVFVWFVHRTRVCRLHRLCRCLVACIFACPPVLVPCVRHRFPS